LANSTLLEALRQGFLNKGFPQAKPSSFGTCATKISPMQIIFHIVKNKNQTTDLKKKNIVLCLI